MTKKESNHEKESSNQKDLTVEQGKSNELSEQQKEELQVKDCQNDQHVNVAEIKHDFMWRTNL